MTVPAVSSDTADDEKTAEDTTETLWRIYGAINEWIRFADVKAGAILTANGVLTGGTITALQGNKGFLVEHPVTSVALVLALLSVVISTLSCLLCIQPSLKADPARSLIYFGHITDQFQGNSRDYTNALRNRLTSPVDAMHEIGDQVWVNAGIADKKNWKIFLAVRFLTFGLGFGLIGGIALLFDA